MPDQAIAFTPYAAPDLTGLRAGQLVSHRGVLYDVRQVEVRETLGGRDHNTGAPLAIETRVDVKLDRATWIDRPWLEAPADVFVLPELQGERSAVINGQAYWLHSVSLNRAYLDGLRRSTTPAEEVPISIELQLLRNPHEDPEAEREPRRSVFDTGDVEAYWHSRNNPEG
jgi:hypothetical protein